MIPGTYLGWSRLNLYHTWYLRPHTWWSYQIATTAAVKRRRRARFSPRIYIHVNKIPLRDVCDVKSREWRKLTKGTLSGIHSLYMLEEASDISFMKNKLRLNTRAIVWSTTQLNIVPVGIIRNGKWRPLTLLEIIVLRNMITGDNMSEDHIYYIIPARGITACKTLSSTTCTTYKHAHPIICTPLSTTAMILSYSCHI